MVIDKDLLVVCLVVSSVTVGLYDFLFHVELFHRYFCSELFEGRPNQFPISRHHEILGIFVSELDKIKLVDDLGVYDSQFVINSLVEHQVVQLRIECLTLRSQNS